MEYTQLIGAEEVARAANRMSNAAQTMSSAATTIDTCLRLHQQFLSEWLIGLEGILEKAKPEAVDVEPTP